MNVYERNSLVLRVLLTFLGVTHLTLGYLFWETRGVQSFAPSFWPWWFLAAGAATIAFATAPHALSLLITSGILTVVGYASRVGALIIVAQRGGTALITVTQFLLGAVVWSVPAVLTGFLWVYIIRPVAEYRRTIR